MSQPKPLTQEEIWKLLEGQENLLKPLAEKEEIVLQHASCPSCQACSHERFVNPRTIFSPGKPLQNTLLRCLRCGSEWDPHSGIILKMATAG